MSAIELFGLIVLWTGGVLVSLLVFFLLGIYVFDGFTRFMRNGWAIAMYYANKKDADAWLNREKKD